MAVMIAKNVKIEYGGKDITDLLTPLKIGDKITVFNRANRFITNDLKVTWEKITVKPTQLIFLGYTHVYNGYINQGSYDYETGYTDPDRFVSTDSVKVMVVQPYDKYNRYRKSFYSLEE